MHARALTNSAPPVLWPASLWLLVFMLLPLLILLVFSLGTRSELGTVELGFNFENYLRFFCGPYLISLWRSLSLAVSTTLVCLVLGFMCALWLVFAVPAKRQGLYLTLLVAPLWTSFLLRIYAWIVILRPTGLLSGMLKDIGIIEPPVILYTPAAVLLGMVYNYLPYMILPLYAALGKLDSRYLEASYDLGATPWRAFLQVTLPLSLRGIVAGVTMVFVPCLGDYVTPDLLGGAREMFIGNLIQNQFLLVRDWAFGSAVSTVLIVIVAAAVWVYLKYGERPEA
jgi:spermidine/putrescine transport system permease protein